MLHIRETRQEVSEGDPQETIVKIRNKFNPGSAELFEFQDINSELFGTSVSTFKECVHINSGRYHPELGIFLNLLDFIKEVC